MTRRDIGSSDGEVALIVAVIMFAVREVAPIKVDRDSSGSERSGDDKGGNHNDGSDMDGSDKSGSVTGGSIRSDTDRSDITDINPPLLTHMLYKICEILIPHFPTIQFLT